MQKGSKILENLMHGSLKLVQAPITPGRDRPGFFVECDF